MNVKSLHIIIAVILVVLVSVVAQKEVIRLLGVKPNIVLLLFAILPFFIQGRIIGPSLVALAVFILSWGSIGAWHMILFFVIGCSFFILPRFLPWHRFVSVFALGIGGTTLFAILSAPLYFFRAPDVLLIEILWNSIAGVSLYFLLIALYDDQEILPAGRQGEFDKRR